MDHGQLFASKFDDESVMTANKMSALDIADIAFIDCGGQSNPVAPAIQTGRQLVVGAARNASEIARARVWVTVVTFYIASISTFVTLHWLGIFLQRFSLFLLAVYDNVGGFHIGSVR